MQSITMNTLTFGALALLGLGGTSGCSGSACAGQSTQAPEEEELEVRITVEPNEGSNEEAVRPAEIPNACRCPRIIADPNRVYHGAFVGDAITNSNVASFEQLAGEDLDIGLIFMAFTTGLTFPTSQAQAMSDRGGAIFIKLEPWSWRGQSDNSFPLQGIIDGNYDNLLEHFATGARDFGQPIFVSFGHEMNGNWYPWAGNPSLYVQAYQHVHETISDIACNITWVWNPNIDRGNLQAYYPGDANADWVAADGYSTTIWGGQCRSFDQLFSGIVTELAAFGRPIMIGETASDAATCPQTDFITSLFTSIDQSISDSSRPDINAFVYFNIRKQESGHDLQWLISSPQSREAYQAGFNTHQGLFINDIVTDCRSTQPPAPAPAAAPTPAPTAAANSALLVNSIRTGAFTFNGGSYSEANGIYTFSATGARDPGFAIQTGNHRLDSRTRLVFDVRGSVEQLGSWARLIVQVYDNDDSDSSPAITLDPIEVSNDFSTITVELNGAVDASQKVQFLLVTDNGSLRVEIRNLRFE